MPLQFKINSAAKLIVSVGAGVIFDEEFQTNREGIMADAKFLPDTFVHLVDLRSIEDWRFQSENLRIAHARWFRDHPEFVTKSAIVTGKRFFGAARMFAGWVGQDEKLQVFVEMEEAWDWLGLTDID